MAELLGGAAGNKFPVYTLLQGIMFGKPPQDRAAINTLGGILIGLIVSYLLLQLPALIHGDFPLDWQSIRFLSLVGLLVVGFSWWENRAR